MKKVKYGCLLLFLAVLLAAALGAGCNAERHVQPQQTEVLPHILRRVENPAVISRLDYPKIEVPGELFIRTELYDGVFLGVKEDTEVIYTFNVADQSLKKLTVAKNTQKYIDLLTLVSNAMWVVWVEDEAYIDVLYSASTKPFRWQIVAYNVSSGETIVVDESPFSTNRFNILPHIAFTPNAIAVSEENIIVYSMNNFDGDMVFSELVAYDLNTRTRQVIARTSDVTQEIIAECAIYGENIVFSRFRILNEHFDYRFTRYKYSDLYIYNLTTGKTEQLTVDDFYHEPDIYKDKLVALYVTPNKPGQAAYNSEVVFMDLDDRQFKTAVHEESPIYQRIEYEMLRVKPRINSRYISWWYFRNRFVYDYRNNQFIELFDGIYEVRDRDNAVVLDMLFDNYALFNINFADGRTSKYLVALQPEDCTLEHEEWLELYWKQDSARDSNAYRDFIERAEAAAEYEEKIGYETMVNSAAYLEIILPAGFDEVINQFEIGTFLHARNELSKQNGFDFSDFMGKRVVLYTSSSEKDYDLVLLIHDQKIIGAWKDSTGEDFHFIRRNTVNIP